MKKALLIAIIAFPFVLSAQVLSDNDKIKALNLMILEYKAASNQSTGSFVSDDHKTKIVIRMEQLLDDVFSNEDVRLTDGDLKVVDQAYGITLSHDTINAKPEIDVDRLREVLFDYIGSSGCARLTFDQIVNTALLMIADRYEYNPLSSEDLYAASGIFYYLVSSLDKTEKDREQRTMTVLKAFSMLVILVEHGNFLPYLGVETDLLMNFSERLFVHAQELMPLMARENSKINTIEELRARIMEMERMREMLKRSQVPCVK